MKTIKQNNKQIQETILKSIFAVIILAVLGFTVNGQNFWTSLENSFDGGLNSGIVEVKNSSDAYIESNFYDLNQVESESSMELERWMVTNNHFGTFIKVEIEMEQPLELESWMMNESLFNVYSGLTTIETEDKLELESWMTNDIYFTESNFAYAKESENSLAVEDWMLNTKHFEVKKAGINSNEDVTYASNQLPF